MKAFLSCALLAFGLAEVNSFLKCLKPNDFTESTWFTCHEESVHYDNNCYHYVIVRLNGNVDEQYYCLLPNINEYDVLLEYHTNSSCSKNASTVAHVGTLGCVPGPYDYGGSCVRFLQIVSGCYSFLPFGGLQIKSTSHQDVTFEVKDTVTIPNTDLQSQIECSGTPIPQYTIVENTGINDPEGARYLLPIRNNHPVACSVFNNRTSPNFNDLTVCKYYGGALWGPCFHVHSQYPRLLVPTAQDVDGDCPRGFYRRQCKCVLHGTQMETDGFPNVHFPRSCSR